MVYAPPRDVFDIFPKGTGSVLCHPVLVDFFSFLLLLFLQVFCFYFLSPLFLVFFFEILICFIQIPDIIYYLENIGNHIFLLQTRLMLFIFPTNSVNYNPNHPDTSKKSLNILRLIWDNCKATLNPHQYGLKTALRLFWDCFKRIPNLNKGFIIQNYQQSTSWLCTKLPILNPI